MRDIKKIKEQLRYIELEKILNNDIQQGIMIITPKTSHSYLTLNDLKVKYVNNCFLNQFNVSKQEALHILPHIYASSIKHIDEGEKSNYLIKDSIQTRMNLEQDQNKEYLRGQDSKQVQVQREQYDSIQQNIIQQNSKILSSIVKNSQSQMKSSLKQNKHTSGVESYPQNDQIFNDVMNLAESTKIVQEEKGDSVHSLPPSIKINKKQVKENSYFTHINLQNNSSLNNTLQPENSQNVLLGLNKYISDDCHNVQTKIKDKKNIEEKSKISIFKNQMFRKANSQKIESSPLQKGKNDLKTTYKQSSIKCTEQQNDNSQSNKMYQINQKPTIIREGSNKNIHATTSRNIIDSHTKLKKSVSQNQINPEGLVNLLERINYYHQRYLQQKDKNHQFKEKYLSSSQRNENSDQKYKQSLIIWEYKKEDRIIQTEERGFRQNQNEYSINAVHSDSNKKENGIQNHSSYKSNKYHIKVDENQYNNLDKQEKKQSKNDKKNNKIDTDQDNFLNLQQNHMIEQEIIHLKNEINSPIIDKEIILSEDNQNQNNNANLLSNEYRNNKNKVPLLQENHLIRQQILISQQNLQDNPESDKITQPNTYTDRTSNKDLINIQQEKPQEQLIKNSFHQSKRKTSNQGLIAKQIDENIIEVIKDKKGDNGFLQGDERNKMMREEDEDYDDEEGDSSRQYLEIKLFECEMDREESIMVIVNNINQRIKYEKLKDMQTKNEQMLANVTHDLKTPLNCMTLMVEGMKFDKQYNEVTLNMILENANLLMCLIQDILDYSQIKKGKLRLVQSYFQVSDVISEVINLFQMQADQKNIKLISNIYRSSNSSANVSLQNNANAQTNIQQTTQNTMNNCSFNTNGGSQNNFALNRNKNNSIAANNETQSFTNINTFNNLNEPIKNIQMHQDKNRIKQILINLISNALKFTQEGHIEIRCDLKEIEDNSNIKIVEFSVKDTGVGMTPLIKSKLFKTFNTFDQKGLNKNGVGLGLTICKRLVTFLGPSDHFEVESEVQKGSTFSFKVFKDLRDIDNTHHTLSDESEESPDIGGKSLYHDIAKSITQNSKQIKMMKEEDQIDESSVVINNIPNSIARPNVKAFHGKDVDFENNSTFIQIPKYIEQKLFNVLIVDDSPFNIVAFKHILKNIQNISIAEAYNGKEALEKYQKLHFDCILMDYIMPIMNGYESTKLIRLYEKQNNLPPCKIIIVSGFDERQKEFNKAMQGGADDYITKPVNFKVLTEKLNSYMKAID